MNIIAAWLGTADIKASKGQDEGNIGPIGQVLKTRDYDRLVLLSDHAQQVNQMYSQWLSTISSCEIDVQKVKLTSPTNFREIYENASEVIKGQIDQYKGEINLTFHITPGTPAMQAIWIILGRTKYPANLVQSSLQQGVEDADIPLEISAEFIPELIKATDKKLRAKSQEKVPTAASFGDIIYRSVEMERIVQMAQKAAIRNLPVLIEGESGTGKELLARAIHNNSSRKDKPFLVINCGAIPAELVESEFFGHKKGAFTGADKDRKGYFEEADNGTIFLDEIGELPLPAQVKLLRVLQEEEVTRLGEREARKVDIRVISATNRDLIDEISKGTFREDLFYRLAVATLKVPPLRNRSGDLGLLVDHLIEQINAESTDEPGFENKNISPGARNLVLKHDWPGNVRELQNTLRRAAVWSENKVLTESDLEQAILLRSPSQKREEAILNRSLSEGIDLQGIIGDVAKHYLVRAMRETRGVKKAASGLLGFANYQTFANWLDRYGIK